MPQPSFGQSSGDFKETSGRVQQHHTVIKNSVSAYSSDALTQANPPVVTSAPNVSGTLSGITKRGVLGGTVVFTRPDAGNGLVGGPVAPSGVYNARIKPLGILLNDAAGNAFENTPGAASGRAPFLCGGGTCSVALYETKNQMSGSAGITYATGDKLYASVNGLLTNVLADAYEYNVSGQNSLPFVTVVGIVRQAPDGVNGLLTLDLRV